VYLPGLLKFAEIRMHGVSSAERRITYFFSIPLRRYVFEYPPQKRIPPPPPPHKKVSAVPLAIMAVLPVGQKPTWFSVNTGLFVLNGFKCANNLRKRHEEIGPANATQQK